MRFRLRTLLLIVTGISLFLGWSKYAQRLAAHHQQEAARVISQIAVAEKAREMEIEGTLSLLEDNKAATKLYPAKFFGRRVVSVRRPAGFETLVLQTNPAEWERALQHRAESKRYERAAWRPWLLVAKKPVR